MEFNIRTEEVEILAVVGVVGVVGIVGVAEKYQDQCQYQS